MVKQIVQKSYRPWMFVCLLVFDYELYGGSNRVTYFLKEGHEWGLRGGQRRDPSIRIGNVINFFFFFSFFTFGVYIKI